MKDGLYIAPAFMDKLVVHIAKNFMSLPNIKVLDDHIITLSYHHHVTVWNRRPFLMSLEFALQYVLLPGGLKRIEPKDFLSRYMRLALLDRFPSSWAYGEARDKESLFNASLLCLSLESSK
jgi:hypothetical protein